MKSKDSWVCSDVAFPFFVVTRHYVLLTIIINQSIATGLGHGGLAG